MVGSASADGIIQLDNSRDTVIASLMVNAVDHSLQVTDVMNDNVGAVNKDATSQGVNVVLIDAHLQDSGILIQAVKPGAQIFLYDSSHDSVHDVLFSVANWSEASGSKIDSLSILSHGIGGAFELGNQWISNTTLDQNAADWQHLGRSLVEGANIDLFGCDVAGPESDGQLLLNRIGTLAGADVFASTNLTGRMGDWQLEAASVGDMDELNAGVAGPFDYATLGKYNWTLTAPVITTTPASLAYTENNAAKVIDSGLTITGGATNDIGATVKISNNYVIGQDILAFTDQLGITGSWDAATGMLTLSGTTTRGNYETALRSVTYINASDAPSTLTRTVAFEVTTEGSNETGSGTRNITVTSVNDAPVLSGANDFTTITEDQTTNTGDLVSTLIAGKVTDVDTGAVQRDRRHGPGQQHGHVAVFRSTTASTWNGVGTVSSSTSALLLRSTDKLRFVPNGQNATTALGHLPCLGPDQRDGGKQGRRQHNRRDHGLQHGHGHVEHHRQQRQRRAGALGSQRLHHDYRGSDDQHRRIWSRR